MRSLLQRTQNSREIAQIIAENKYGGSALGIFIEIKDRHITEDQFRQAAVKAFEARGWHVNNAENNIVTSTYERAERVYKSRMIYQPDKLTIKFDHAMGSRSANYLRALRTLFFSQIENKNSQDSNDDLETIGLSVNIKNKDINEDQFQQAAVKAFEARKWQVDNAENNTVSGTFERGSHVYKGSMIYQPSQLIIKLDGSGKERNENHLYALRTQFFRQIEGKNNVDEVAIYVDIKNKNISEEQFRAAAVTAFESRKWRIDKAEKNVVAGAYERGNHVYKGRMISSSTTTTQVTKE